MLNDLLCDLPEKIWPYLKWLYLGKIVLILPGSILMFAYNIPQLMIFLLILGVAELLIYIAAIILDT